MKKYPAIAILEFDDIPTGFFATDLMLKKSPILLLKSGIISEGRYLTMIGGSTASVDESFAEGLFWGKDHIVDQVILPDVHPQVHDAVLGRRNTEAWGSMAILETPTVSCNVRAAELALKGTTVELVEIRLAESALAGKGVSIYRGELYDIQAAVDIATSFLKQAGVRVSSRVIPAPHDGLSRQLESDAYFERCKTVALDGELE
ncbi:MAG: BMC domain protein [Verrucomicrobia bacterium ADurb.Bin345]|nr:MAG: BMC domain protein [Verrucomicrobia bacterium ADurb.Bin345]